MLYGVRANSTLLSFYDYDKQTRISPSTYLLTVSERPVLLRWVAGTAEFWKMKRPTISTPKYYRGNNDEIRPALRGEAIWSGRSILPRYIVGFTFL